jgi:hypothetical protein
VCFDIHQPMIQVSPLNLVRNSCRLLGNTVVVLLLSVSSGLAAPCDVIKARPDVWMKRTVNVLVSSARAVYERDSAESAYERVIDATVKLVDKCRLAQDAQFSTRYPEFIGFIATLALERKPDHELGFNVPDKVYFDQTRQYVDIPDFLLAPAFLRAASRSETLPAAKTMLRLLNTGRPPEEQLIYFSYESRHLGTPDNPDSFRRLLIVVPGNAAAKAPEKWVQFGISDPGHRARVRNVSVVAVVPALDGTTNAYFKDYFRTFRRSGEITIKGRWELGEGDDNCTQCHKSGILPIFPEAGSVSSDEQAAVEKVNQRFLEYGRPRFGKYLDTSKLGPGLGSRALLTSSGKKVMCAECHQPNQLGSLNWPMDRVLISSYVNGGLMPLGFQLTTAERSRLYKQLIQDYFAIDEAKPGILKSWLLGGNRLAAN